MTRSNTPTQAPRKSKYYKNAELKVRALMRRLSSFRDEVSFESRPTVEAVIKQAVGRSR